MSIENQIGEEEIPVDVVSRHLACENTKFFVYFDHVVDKAGEEVKNYLVVSPKITGKNLVTGVAILPIVDEKVGLIRIYRPAIRDYSWEIPHGFVDEGETNSVSALRELLEETGLMVDPPNLVSMGYITPDTGVLAARVHMYLAKAYVSTQEIQRELGIRELRLFNFTEFEELIMKSDVQDTFTLAAWCKYQLLLKEARNYD